MYVTKFNTVIYKELWVYNYPPTKLSSINKLFKMTNCTNDTSNKENHSNSKHNRLFIVQFFYPFKTEAFHVRMNTVSGLIVKSERLGFSWFVSFLGLC